MFTSSRNHFMRDQVTVRFIECFEYLKLKGQVRSARQFAISLDTYPQSFNEILKGRREVSLCVLRRFSEKYHVSGDYLLTGMGRILKAEREEDRKRGKVNTFEQMLSDQRESINNLHVTIEKLVSQTSAPLA